MGGVDNIFYFWQFVVSLDFQFVMVWFYQLWCCFQFGNQCFVVVVENNVWVLVVQMGYLVGEGFWVNVGWQVVVDVDYIELFELVQGVVDKVFLVVWGDFKVGEVEIGYFVIFFCQFNVDMGLVLYYLEMVGDFQFVEQLLKVVLVVFIQEIVDGDVNVEIFQYFCYINVFFGGVQVGGVYQVYFVVFNFWGEFYQVVCWV